MCNFSKFNIHQKLLSVEHYNKLKLTKNFFCSRILFLGLPLQSFHYLPTTELILNSSFFFAFFFLLLYFIFLFFLFFYGAATVTLCNGLKRSGRDWWLICPRCHIRTHALRLGYSTFCLSAFSSFPPTFYNDMFFHFISFLQLRLHFFFSDNIFNFNQHFLSYYI